jgi:hypothetical protein
MPGELTVAHIGAVSQSSSLPSCYRAISVHRGHLQGLATGPSLSTAATCKVWLVQSIPTDLAGDLWVGALEGVFSPLEFGTVAALLPHATARSP